MQQQGAQFKNRLLPALVKLGFDNWEEIFDTRKDDILIQRIMDSSMSPFIPEGSIVLADTSCRWPIEGEIFLVQYNPQFVPHLKYICWMAYKAPNPQKRKFHPLTVQCRDFSYGTWKTYKGRRENIRITPEEAEARRVNWIVGRVIGAVTMYHLP